MPLDGLRLEAEAVADVGAAVEARVGVQHLDPLAGRRQSEPPAVAHDGREVGDADELPRAVLRDAREGEHVLGRRVRLEPAEAVGREVDLPERGLVAVDAVQVADERTHARVVGIVEQVPVERARLLAPLALLPELAAHEERAACRGATHM